MKILALSILIILTHLPAQGQMDVAGIYQFSFICGSQRLNLMPDSIAVLTFTTRGPTVKIVGRWKLSQDTIIILKIISFEELNNITRESDTLFFKIRSEFALEQFAPQSDLSLMFNKGYTYYSTGEIKQEIKGFHTSVYGSITSFYPNGNLKQIQHYRKGLKSGLYLKFNERGVLLIKGHWRKGKPVRHWNYYDE